MKDQNLYFQSQSFSDFLDNFPVLFETSLLGCVTVSEYVTKTEVIFLFRVVRNIFPVSLMVPPSFQILQI